MTDARMHKLSPDKLYTDMGILDFFLLVPVQVLLKLISHPSIPISSKLRTSLFSHFFSDASQPKKKLMPTATTGTVVG